MRRLADDIGVSRSTATVAVKQLIASGLVVVEAGSGRAANAYVPQSPNSSGPLLPWRSVPKIGTQADSRSVPKIERSVPKIERSVPKIGTEYNRIDTEKKRKARARAASDIAEPEDRSEDRTALARHWLDGWKARYGADYGNPREDLGKILTKLILRTGGKIDRAKSVLDAYLATDDDWTLRRGHLLADLVRDSQLNRYIAASSQPPTDEDDIRANYESPCWEELRGYWPKDVEAHCSDWAAILLAMDEGRLPANAIRSRRARRNGAKVRVELLEEAKT